MKKIVGLPAKFYSTRITGFQQELGEHCKDLAKLSSSQAPATLNCEYNDVIAILGKNKKNWQGQNALLLFETQRQKMYER